MKFITDSPRHIAMGLLASMLMAMGGAMARSGDVEVDLALILALDCSGSVNDQEFALQTAGLGRAFQHKAVQEAIERGALKAIAVSVVQWSGNRHQVTAVPWTIIASGRDADNFGALVTTLARRIDPAATSISSLLNYSERLLDIAPQASRQVIDVSADGPGNIGPPLNEIRGRLLLKGITINGLAIQNEWPKLAVYMQDHVAGGEGHFVIPAKDYQNYFDAILIKLVREITRPGIS